MLAGMLVLMPGCAAMNEALSNECAGATVLGAGAGGLAGVLVGKTVLKDASREVQIAVGALTTIAAGVAANRACQNAKAQQREIDRQFAAAQAEIDSLRAAQGQPALSVPPPRVEVVQVQNEETNQTEAVMTKIEFGSDVLAYSSGSATLPEVAPIYLRPLASTLAGSTQQIIVVGHTRRRGRGVFQPGALRAARAVDPGLPADSGDRSREHAGHRRRRARAHHGQRHARRPRAQPPRRGVDGPPRLMPAS